MEDLKVALGLSLIGLIGAFVGIYMVILIGEFLIRLTNRFLPVKESSDGRFGGSMAHTKKLAAIIAAVDTVTRGKGKINSIQQK